MRKIKVKAEYGTSSLWVKDEDEGFFDTFELEDLEFQLPHDLKIEFLDWNEIYQSTFDTEYPPNSGFKEFEQEEEFHQIGRVLTKKLAMVLSGKFEVLDYVGK